MHDWTLVSMRVDWKEGQLIIQVVNDKSMLVDIISHGFKCINIPKWDKWGDSISINKLVLNHDGNYHILDIEMQSGDVINIIADTITIPN